MHCFVLLGVSSIQLKHYRVRVEQCYLISGFRISTPLGARALGKGHLPRSRFNRVARAFSPSESKQEPPRAKLNPLKNRDLFSW
jgi:hypothetical protein